MVPQALKVGNAYYRLTYADPEFTIPGVEPMIYIGVNVTDDDKNSPVPIYAFQDTVSFFRFGSVVDYDGPSLAEEDKPQVYFYDEKQLGELADLAAAAEALQTAVRRSHSKGGRSAF